jgi:uncharacterized protein YgiM (DUF1202 family)
MVVDDPPHHQVKGQTMKKPILLLPLLALACSLSANVTPPDPKTRRAATASISPTQTTTCTVSALETLNLRAEAGTFSEVIDILEHGETVTILPHSSQGNWILVRAANAEGWINALYCKDK